MDRIFSKTKIPALNNGRSPHLERLRQSNLRLLILPLALRGSVNADFLDYL